MQKYYSLTEAANLLKLKRSYLYKLVSLGKITTYKPSNGKVYFTEDDLEAFVKRGRRAADYELLGDAE